MPRALRTIDPDLCYHVINRGNARQAIFHKPGDYQAFVGILAEGLRRFGVELLCWCLMPNHWHLVLRPRSRTAMIDFMRWVTVTHVRRHQRIIRRTPDTSTRGAIDRSPSRRIIIFSCSAATSKRTRCLAGRASQRRRLAMVQPSSANQAPAVAAADRLAGRAPARLARPGERAARRGGATRGAHQHRARARSAGRRGSPHRHQAPPHPHAPLPRPPAQAGGPTFRAATATKIQGTGDRKTAHAVIKGSDPFMSPKNGHAVIKGSDPFMSHKGK